MATHTDKISANSEGYRRLLSFSSKHIGIRNLGRTIFEGTPTCPAPLRPTDGYWSFQDFELTRLLGDGSLSTVVAATSTRSHFPVAIKVYHRDRLTNLNHRQIAREIEVHAALLPHPNIITLYAAFEDAAGIYLVQELAPSGDLYGSLFKRGGYFTEAAVATTVLPGVLAAITHAHSLGILHRDIKSENILIASDGTIKLADFGLAINLSKDQPVSRVGTLDYMPPEIVTLPRSGAPIPALPHHQSKTSLPYGLPADIWCIGILVYELLVGAPPFETASKEATYIRIAKVEPSLPSHLSEEAKSFLTITLQKEPRARPTIMQLISHSWVLNHQSVHVTGRGGGVNAQQQQQQQQEGVSASSTSSSALSSSSSSAGGSTSSKPISPRQKQSSGYRSSIAFNWKLSSTIKQIKARSKLSNDEDDTVEGGGSPPCQTIKAVRQPGNNNNNNINVSSSDNGSSPLSLSSSSSPKEEQQLDSPRKSRIFAKLFNGRKSAYSTTTMMMTQSTTARTTTIRQ
jgi:aurora kinase, other